MKSKKPILVLGSYGRGNIGDDAFLLAALKLFKGHTLYVNSANDSLLPNEVRENFQTISTTGYSDILRKIKIFFSTKHIVYCGGDLWVELHGDKYPRQALYKMTIVNLMARILGKRIHYLGCGAGDISGYSLFLARFSANLANTIALREKRSFNILQINRAITLPDLVTTLDINPVRREQTGKFTIGISILYFIPNPKQNFPKLVNSVAAYINALPKEKYRIVLYPMLISEEEPHDDMWAILELKALLKDSDVTIFNKRNIESFTESVGQLDLMIATRLHASILALLKGTPIIGVSYRPKVRQFYEACGLDDYCIDLENLEQHKLSSLTTNIQSRVDVTNDVFNSARQTYISDNQEYLKLVSKNF